MLPLPVLGLSVVTATPASRRFCPTRTRMSDPSASIVPTKGNHMYLVKNGTQVLASCETHDLAFEFFMTYGGFFEKDLVIEKEYA
jgi:hypothetical protein